MAAAVKFDPLVVQQAGNNASRLKLTLVPREEVDQALEKKDESIVRLREENKALIERGPKDAALILGLGAVSAGAFTYANGRWGHGEGVAKIGNVPIDLTAGGVLAAIGLAIPNRGKSKNRDYWKEGFVGVGMGGVTAGLMRYALQTGLEHYVQAEQALPPEQRQKQFQGTPTPQQFGPGQPAATHWDGQNLFVPEPKT